MMDSLLVTLKQLLNSSNGKTPMPDDTWTSVEGALKDQSTFPPADQNLAELMKASLKVCLEQLASGSSGGQFEYQVFQTVALLCRYEVRTTVIEFLIGTKLVQVFCSDLMYSNLALVYSDMHVVSF